MTYSDIVNAVNMIGNAPPPPQVLGMSRTERDKIVNLANKVGIKTKREDGNDYLLGRKIVTYDNLTQGELAYEERML